MMWEYGIVRGTRTFTAWLCLMVVGYGCGGSGAASQSLPFSDDFSGDCQWPSGSNDDSFSYGCSGGRYEMKLRQDGDNAYHITQDFGFEAGAVRAQVTAAVVGGGGLKKGALLGVGCLKDDHHGYVAAVGTYGVWGIARLEKDFTWLTGTTSRSSTISAAPIVVGIICAKASDGSTTVALLEDGKMVGSTTDRRRPGFDSFSAILLYANTYPGVVAYDEFAARKATVREVANGRANATNGEAGRDR
jgi:hypothetical protein